MKFSFRYGELRVVCEDGDKAEALRYYKKAQQLGYPDATEALNKLQSD
ncbi:hypothetical protein PQR62_17625 [Herbaspirillum lusitanum]|uniref:Sel1 repeat family protein n=1 Tax=Herbaspirillum lusitanum TaxID=213312 RepID=A0ABW9ADK8_9BURK